MNNSKRSIPQYIFLFFILTFLWAGCARIPLPTRSVHTGQSGEVGSCADFFTSLDKRIEEAEVLDPGVFRVKNYPYLRVNRFVASFRDEVDEKEAFSAVCCCSSDSAEGSRLKREFGRVSVGNASSSSGVYE